MRCYRRETELGRTGVGLGFEGLQRAGGKVLRHGCRRGWGLGLGSVECLRTGEGTATPPATTGSPKLHHGSGGHIRGGERGRRPRPPASALSMPPLRLPVGMLPRLGANPQQITAPGSRKKRLIPFALLLAAPIPGSSERERSSPRCPQGPASPKTQDKDDNPRISSSRDPLSSERWMEKAGGAKSEGRPFTKRPDRRRSRPAKEGRAQSRGRGTVPPRPELHREEGRRRLHTQGGSHLGRSGRWAARRQSG